MFASLPPDLWAAGAVQEHELNYKKSFVIRRADDLACSYPDTGNPSRSCDASSYIVQEFVFSKQTGNFYFGVR